MVKSPDNGSGYLAGLYQTKDRVVGQGWKEGVEVRPGMRTCYTGDYGTLAPMLPTFTEPDWNKGARRKAASPKE